MRKFYYTMFGNRQEVSEENFTLAYKASATYFERVSKADPLADVPTDWRNGYLSGTIEETPEA